MRDWVHSISKLKKKGDNCIVAGKTFDTESGKNIEWEFEITSDGTLVRSAPEYIAELYKATKLNEVMIKKVWNTAEQIRRVFKAEEIRQTWVVNEQGCISRTE